MLSGTLVQTLSSGVVSQNNAGSAFDKNGNFYVTEFDDRYRLEGTTAVRTSWVRSAVATTQIPNQSSLTRRGTRTSARPTGRIRSSSSAPPEPRWPRTHQQRKIEGPTGST